MTENWVATALSKKFFHQCLFLLMSSDEISTYCLTLKNWNEPCPPRCPYYKAGIPANLEELQSKKYKLSCRKLSRKTLTRTKITPFCNLYFMREPECQQCNFETT
ncbi:MAG: hypothetical protein ACFFDC_17340 [Promethearchaeota archaeon]